MIKQHIPPTSVYSSLCSSMTRSIVDILVVNAADFVCHIEKQVQLVSRIADLAQRTKRSTRSAKGIWILLMIHSSPKNMDELEVAKTFSTAVSAAHSPWIWGVRMVEESTTENTAHAAWCLHQLHFPTIAEKYRSNYILVLGSRRERSISV